MPPRFYKPEWQITLVSSEVNSQESQGQSVHIVMHLEMANKCRWRYA